MRVKQPGSGSRLVWILAGRQLLFLLLDPSLDQLADAGTGALVTGLFQPLNISPDSISPGKSIAGSQCRTREEVYDLKEFSSN